MLCPDPRGGNETARQNRRQGSKNATPQDVEAPQCVKGRSSPKPFAAGANEKIALLTRERDEALEQLAATSEVLQVISSSPTDLQSILDMVGENAARLCDANNAVIFCLEGDLLRQVAVRCIISNSVVSTQGASSIAASALSPKHSSAVSMARPLASLGRRWLP